MKIDFLRNPYHPSTLVFLLVIPFFMALLVLLLKIGGEPAPILQSFVATWIFSTWPFVAGLLLWIRGEMPTAVRWLIKISCLVILPVLILMIVSLTREVISK